MHFVSFNVHILYKVWTQCRWVTWYIRKTIENEHSHFTWLLRNWIICLSWKTTTFNLLILLNVETLVYWKHKLCIYPTNNENNLNNNVNNVNNTTIFSVEKCFLAKQPLLHAPIPLCIPHRSGSHGKVLQNLI